MKTYNNQRELADLIIHLLHSSEINEIRLVGSLSENNFDNFSDIDILLKDTKRSPVENINLALKTIQSNLDVIFSDWAKSLLPEKYVLSIFLKQENIFWYIDLSCYRDKNFQDTCRESLPQDKIYHMFKLWICNAKQEVRKREERNNIDIVYLRIFHDSDSVSKKEKYAKILDWLFQHSDDMFLLNKCSKIMELINEKS